MRRLVFPALFLFFFGCKDKGSPAPAPSSTAAAQTPSSAPSSRLKRDEMGHLSPKTPRPQDNPADMPPHASRDPDWDLDKSDPARDYVERYVRATMRYGPETKCVETKVSGQSGAKAIVEVRDKKDGCPTPRADARDVFLVDVTGDRLESAKGGTLAKWPDGSDPAAPANASPVELDPWSSPLKDVLIEMRLTPIRAQAYGRGSYLLVTIAGWRAPVTVNAPPELTRPFAERVCAATGGLPIAFVAGIDRATVLRVKCPGTARWDRF